MRTAIMDFYSDWIGLLRQELAGLGYGIPSAAEPQEICFRWRNYHKRGIKRRRRLVEESREFVVPPDLQTAYAGLKAKMEQGDDLRLHLSRKLTDPDYNDPMLNDWGIHHLHLGVALEADGFVVRSESLLYARVLPDKVLCLQILSHANWTNRQLMEIWHANWPQTLEAYRLKGITGAVFPISNDELGRLRDGNVFTIVTMSDGTVYAPPGGGISTSGLAADVVEDCDRHACAVKQLEEQVRQNLDHIANVARNDGVVLPDECRIRLYAAGRELVVMEETSRWGFKVSTCER